MAEAPVNPILSAARSFPSERDGVLGTADGDSELLRRVRLGDQDAMAAIFRRYGGIVYSVALRVLRDPGQAEDVMQEIFFQLWRTSETYAQGRGSLGAWLSVVARNRSIDALRRRRPSDPVEDVVLASSQDLSSEAERNMMVEKVRKHVKDLPAEQRTSIEMAFFQGLSHTEIAARTGDPLGTVKTRIRQALLSVRKALEG